MKNICKTMGALIAAMTMSMSGLAKSQDIGGTVINEKGEPIAYANVVLLSLPDSAFVQGDVTDEQGRFNIVTSLTTGILKLTSVGYQTMFVDVKPASNLTIEMKEDNQLLSEVVVKGQLPQTHAKGDAMRTTVAGTILEKAGTLTDALSKARSKYRGSGAGSQQKARM